MPNHAVWQNERSALGAVVLYRAGAAKTLQHNHQLASGEHGLSMPEPSRMKDVALLAGVSTMTVSRVLNSNIGVTEGVRQRVFKAVEQLRYQPNEVARSLREKRSRQIGVIVPYLSDPFFATCAHTISGVARSHAYSVVLSTSDEDPQAEYEEASRMLRRNVEGLLLIPADTRGKRSLLLADKFTQRPIVTLDRPVAGSGFESVLVENERGAMMGTEHLLKLGHKRIVYVGLRDSMYTMAMRRSGYEAAMRSTGLTPEVLFLSGALEDSLEAVRLLTSRVRPPMALMSANNLITRHLLHSLQQLGMQPPSPVALLGFDDFDMADLMQPGITVVRQPAEVLGQIAAELLFKKFENSQVPVVNQTTVLPVELVVRGSCGAKL